MSWCTIESDPGVFTSLIEDIGVKGVQVEELYSLDESSFVPLQPIYGIIFLFKWDPQVARPSTSVSNNIPEDLFFAKQVINNACATQALLSILLNTPTIELGETLNEFLSFTKDFPPDLKGLAISNSDKIRTVHNGFSQPEPFVMDKDPTPPTDKDEVYHFVAYVPFHNNVYELDGLQEKPVCLGSYSSNNDWISIVKPVIQQRIERYSSSEIRFNLLALIQNRKELYENQLLNLSESDTHEKEILKSKIKYENEKFENWKIENIRRKHNYIPFIIQLLKILAEKNELKTLIQKAKDQQQQQNSTN